MSKGSRILVTAVKVMMSAKAFDVSLSECIFIFILNNLSMFIILIALRFNVEGVVFFSNKQTTDSLILIE